MNLKFLLFTLSFSLLGTSLAQADFLDANGILRNADGSIHRMKDWEARGVGRFDSQKVGPDACEAYGGHLPTARELAIISQSLGALGILEKGAISQYEAFLRGYSLVSAVNPDGSKDEFYFNFEGYQRPSNDLGNERFWSSSSPQDNPNPFMLDGQGGSVFFYWSPQYNYDQAVLCAPGMK